jgi:hypothetical protein
MSVCSFDRDHFEIEFVLDRNAADVGGQLVALSETCEFVLLVVFCWARRVGDLR